MAARVIFIIFSICLAFSSYAEEECDANCKTSIYTSRATPDLNSISGVKIPTSMPEVFIELDRILNEDDKKSIVNDPDLLSHNELRFWIERSWGLFNKSKLHSYFVENGLRVHPDSMVQIIFNTYARHYQGLPPELSVEFEKGRFEKALDEELDKIVMLELVYKKKLPLNVWAHKVTRKYRTIMKSNNKFQCLFYSNVLHKYQVLEVEYDSQTSHITYGRREPPTWVKI